MSLLNTERRAYSFGVPRAFKDVVRELRGRKKLSQERLGVLLGQKRPSTVQSWERGVIPREQSIQRLAAVLECDVAILRPVCLTAVEAQVLEALAKVPQAQVTEAVAGFGDLVEQLRHDVRTQSVQQTAAAARAATPRSRGQRQSR